MMLFSDILPGGGGTAIAEGDLHSFTIALCSMRAILLWEALCHCRNALQTTQYYTALYCTALHCAAQHYTAPYYTTMHCSKSNWIVLRCPTLHTAPY
jgi:hypothetical protein